MSVVVIAIVHPWEKKKYPNCFSNSTGFLLLLQIILIAIFASVLSAGSIIFIKKKEKKTYLLSENQCPEKIFFYKNFQIKTEHRISYFTGYEKQ